jgi:hypothetical protein
VTERIRPLIPCDDIAYAPGQPFVLSRVPIAGDYLRLGRGLYSVSNVVLIVGGDVAADVYLSPVSQQELEAEIELFSK